MSLVLLTLGLKMYKRIPFDDSGIAETLVGMAISLAYQPIVRRTVSLFIRAQDLGFLKPLCSKARFFVPDPARKIHDTNIFSLCVSPVKV